MNDITKERLRILRAARDGRLKLNDAGRYVIDGEDRPDRKVRKSLLYSDPPLITWPSRFTGGVVNLTPDGRSDLGHLEAME